MSSSAQGHTPSSNTNCMKPQGSYTPKRSSAIHLHYSHCSILFRFVPRYRQLHDTENNAKLRDYYRRQLRATAITITTAVSNLPTTEVMVASTLTMPPRSSLTSSFSVSDANNEVVCPLRNQDGSSCRKRCLGVSVSALLLLLPYPS